MVLRVVLCSRMKVLERSPVDVCVTVCKLVECLLGKR